MPSSSWRCRRSSRPAEDAGIDPRDVDGFASYGNDRSDAPRLAAALGMKELRFSNMHWGGGGGGVAAAVANAGGGGAFRHGRIASSPSARSPRGSSPATAAPPAGGASPATMPVTPYGI